MSERKSSGPKKTFAHPSEEGTWEHLKDRAPQPKGPEKPWEAEMDQAAEEFVGFLKDPQSKRELHEFVRETYKKFAEEKAAQVRARFENEKRVNENRLEPFHDSGNLAPLMSEALNMAEVEMGFSRGLKSTQKYLVRSVEDRVEEINRLLAGLGGFNSQLKSCFARSTVVFLEQEDAKHNYRDRLIFSINLPNYELKRQWDRDVLKGAKTAEKEANDPRTKLQATWDDAVNALAQIIATTGLKPKYCKNDRHYGRFVMKQDLRSSTNLPDEYFSFTLDYNTQERIKDMAVVYDRIVGDYNKRIGKLARKAERIAENTMNPRELDFRRKYLALVQERDTFIATTPDPNQLDEGLLFLIEVSTLKDYHVVKDRIQSIMTKYILHLSRLAVKDAEVDPEMAFELWKSGQGARKPSADEKTLSMDDLDSVQEYEVVDPSALRPISRKKSA